MVNTTLKYHIYAAKTVIRVYQTPQTENSLQYYYIIIIIIIIIITVML